LIPGIEKIHRRQTIRAAYPTIRSVHGENGGNVENRKVSSHERMEALFTGGHVDRTPMIGGWLAPPEHVCAITGKDIEQYWEDPMQSAIDAYKMLGTDALVHVFIPISRTDFRGYDKDTYAKAERGYELDQAVEIINEMPSPDKIEDEFEFEEAYEEFSNELESIGEKCGDMVYMPAQWNAGAHGAWYREFGYETFFLLVGLYPDKVQKLFEIGGAQGRCRSKVVAKAVREGKYPHAVLLGEDLCTQRGPMISPDFLYKHFIPQLRYGLEPLLEVGCKPVWHTDGNANCMIDMLIEAGVQGFQGFQPECGVYVEDIINKRTSDGDPLLIFGPMSVVSELRVLDAEGTRKKVQYYMELCRDKARLAMFVSNIIGPDIPVENILAMHNEVYNNFTLLLTS